jgi:hypothetical protein
MIVVQVPVDKMQAAGCDISITLEQKGGEN